MLCDIVPFQPSHQASFEALNRRWLEAYFRIEPIDAEVLGDPETHIIQPGGQILMAIANDVVSDDGSEYPSQQPAKSDHGPVIGTCALKSHPDNQLELTKMAVDPAAQGCGIGNQLMEAAINYFQGSGASLLWLETNHVLKPAITLYEKYGFKRIGHGPRPGSRYQRSDYYMEWLPHRPGNCV